MLLVGIKRDLALSRRAEKLYKHLNAHATSVYRGLLHSNNKCDESRTSEIQGAAFKVYNSCDYPTRTKI